MLDRATSPARRLTTLSAILSVAILVWAPGAGAQSVADQYVPQLDKGGVSDGGSSGTATSPGGTQPPAAGSPAVKTKQVASESQGEGDEGGGSAGGFPLNTFVTALGLIVLLALVARVLLPMLNRGTASVRAR